MNGILPGPLLLAIASAPNSSSFENGTLIQGFESDTVDGKMADIERISSAPQTKGNVGQGSDVPRTTHEARREGG